MAFLERMRFAFFDLKENVDSGKIAEALGTARVTSCTSGYGSMIIGDSSGFIHVVSKAFEIRSFRAYNISVTLTEQSRSYPYLVTIGEDNGGANPLIKIWHIEKVKNDMQVCLRVIKTSIPNKAVVPSCIAITDNLSMMAIGFTDGSIILYRGDVKRERTSKQTLINDELSCITGVALGVSNKTTTLYVATVNTIEMYNVTQKEIEPRITLADDAGCPLKCSVLVEVENRDKKENQFFVAQSKAVFSYTNSLGPCYAIEGEKVQLQWFKGYLVIISKNNQTKINAQLKDSNKTQVITVLDIQNNITAFNCQIPDVATVLIEWGDFYILSTDNSLSKIEEKDIPTKLALLFKRNMYEIAIRIAKYHQYNTDGWLAEIFRQYGDHLYSKGEHKGAIDQYIKTIGKLEPSYVIRKYLGSQQVENLTTYLQALHKEGVATGGHTTLLLNFYTKLNKPELLKEFIMTKDRDVDFDIEIAIDVCRHVSADDALLLAEKHGRHDWYIMIQTEDMNQYKEALRYIEKLPFFEADHLIKKYCNTLLAHVPEETTKFLVKHCTKANDTFEMPGIPSLASRSSPEKFVHYFLNNSEMLVYFLENIINTTNTASPQIYTTLLEHYLEIWSTQESKLQYENKIMSLLENSDQAYNKMQALLLCKTANFERGVLYLYEQNNMFKSILKHHMGPEPNYDAILSCCRRYEHQEPGLWVQALWYITSQPSIPPKVLSDILSAIERGNLLSPLMVIEAFSHAKYVKFGHVKEYLRKIISNEQNTINEQNKHVNRYKSEIDEIKNEIEELKTKPVLFQSSRCSICKRQLELPTVHFLCQHSFHKNCIEDYAYHANECPPCQESNKQIIEAIKSQEENKDLHEMFHSQLDHADDGFALVTEYLGRGVFTKLSHFTETELKAAVLKSKLDKISTVPKNTSHSQPKMIKNESPKNSYLKKEELVIDSQRNRKPLPVQNQESDRISKAIVSTNPFGDDSNDADDEESINNNDQKTPFDDDEDEEENDDYDPELNPFA